MSKQRRTFSAEFKREVAAVVLGQSYYHIDAYRSPGGVDSALQHWAAAPTGARWRDPEEQSASPQAAETKPEMK